MGVIWSFSMHKSIWREGVCPSFYTVSNILKLIFFFNLALNSAADSNLRSDASEFHTFVLKNLIIDIMYSVRTLGSE